MSPIHPPVTSDEFTSAMQLLFPEQSNAVLAVIRGAKRNVLIQAAEAQEGGSMEEEEDPV